MGFSELVGEGGSVVPWEELGSPRGSTLETLNDKYASDTPPRRNVPHGVARLVRYPSSEDDMQAGYRSHRLESNPTGHPPFHLHGSSTNQTHFDAGLDLPAFASRPAQYRPLLDASTPRRPLSALASLPSYHSAHSSRITAPPTPSEPDSAALWTPVGRSTSRSSGGWRAPFAETAHNAREAMRGTIERASAILSPNPDGHGTTRITTRGAPIGQISGPPLVQDTLPAHERRRSMDDWWTQVVQKSEEG